MKKMLALMLAVCMVFGLLAPVSAVEKATEIETTANNAVLAKVHADLTRDIGINTTTDSEMLAEMATMKQNYIEFICGTEENNSSEAVASTTKLTTVINNANTAYNALIADKAERTNALFTGVVLDESTNSANYTTTAKNITFMGLAYATPGCEGWYQNEEIRDLIITLLQEFYVFFNNENLMDTYFGNWWDWEIGVPNQLSQLFVIMEDEIAAADPDLFAKYIACLDAYLQNGKDGDVDLTSRFHTGANLADITMNRILQGIVTKDGERITNGVANMMTVFAQIDPNNIVNGNTDGVYADGSFIQHHRVAYTGSYGTTLLKKASQSVIVLSGTRFQPEDQLDTLQEWIYECFTPITFEGYVMEIVKGRAISRTGTGYGDCNTIVDCSLQILPFLNEEDGAALREHIKYLVDSRVANKTTAANLSLGVIGAFTEIMNDSTEAVNHAATGHYAFNAMDRNVHVREDYAFALSRSSDRISKYEYMSGENKQAWFQGDGAFYLYQADRNQAQTYGHVFYAITGAYNLPGTTVPVEIRQTIQEWTNGLDYYYNEDPKWGFTLASDVNQNDYVYFPVGTNNYSGSVALNGYGAAGMELGDDNTYAAWEAGIIPEDFVTYKNAEANKAYFMFDDEIVILTANIHDTKGRDVMSTIDSRMSEADDPASVVVGYADGTTADLAENGKQENVQWVAYNTAAAGTNVGYYFLDGNTVTFANGLKSADLNEFRKQNTGIVERNLFTMTYEHGAVTADNADSYAYVILPNADAAATAAYAAAPAVKVLANTAAVQAVEQTAKGITGYMFFGEAEVNGLKASSEASVLTQKDGSKLTVAVSDPIFTQDEIVLTLDGEYAVAEANENIAVETKDGKTVLTINVKDAYGASFEIVLQEQAPAFTDVPADSFYADAVAWAVEMGITTGATETTFDPNGKLLRAQVVTMLWRAAGEPKVEAENPFADVKETDFFYNAVLWAVETGITTGISETEFAPYGVTNRAQAVTFLWRAAGEPEAAAANDFSDVAAGAWYENAINWAVENEITNGMGDGTFGINDDCNRAHMVTFLFRAMAE